MAFLEKTMVNSPFLEQFQGVAAAGPVVKFTNTIDKLISQAHRQSNAAAFGMCAGLAFSPVTHKKGGK
jgi:hypothetical protein